MEAPPAKLQKRNRQAMEAIAARLKEMQNYVDRICNQLKMSASARTAAEKVYKSVICGKRWLFFDKHSDEERMFLRMMVRLALATDPSLVPEAEEVAKYYSANYGFEWLQSEMTAPAREEAKAMILSVGESSYGAADTAAALAYARCHYKTLRHDEVGDFGKTYAMAASLTTGSDLVNLHNDWRKELGLDKLRGKREGILGSEAETDAEEG